MKLTEDIIAKVAEMLRVGATNRLIAARLDIPEHILGNWLALGEDEDDDIYGRAVHEWRKAIAESEYAVQRVVWDSAMSGNTTDAKWWLKNYKRTQQDWTLIVNAPESQQQTPLSIVIRRPQPDCSEAVGGVEQSED